MASGIEVLAQLFRERDNPFVVHYVRGTVISPSPLQVSYGPKIILTDGDDLFVPVQFKTGYKIPYQYMDTNGNMMDAETTFKIELQNGDIVLLGVSDDKQTYYLLAQL